MSVITYFFVSRQKIGLKTERTYLALLVCSLLVFILGILSDLAMKNNLGLNHIFMIAANKAYLVSIEWYTVFALLYTFSTCMNDNQYGTRASFAGLLGGFGSIVIFTMPNYIYRSNDVMYSYGEANAVFFFLSVAVIILCLVEVLIHRKSFSPARRYAHISWIALWLGFALLRVFKAEHQFMAVGCCLSTLVIFISLENPEANIERNTGFFNAPSFALQIRELYNSNTAFSLLGLSMEPGLLVGTGAFQVDALMPKITAFLRTIPDVKIFRIQDRSFYIICKNSTAMDDVHQVLKNQFIEGWKEVYGNRVFFDPFFLLVPYSEICNSSKEYEELLAYLMSDVRRHAQGQELLVDFDLASEPRKNIATQIMVLEAMKENRVEVFYQPIYSVQEKRFVSAEALARIRDREGKIIPPDRFIRIIESTGNIVQFGEKVFEKICQFIAEGNLEKLGLEYIELNMSIKQMERPNHADVCIAIMEKYGVDPHCLNFEITESGALSNRHVVESNMTRLISVGIEFSLDDFGSGESNLDYILNMPVKIIKYDRNMTQASFINHKAKFVVPYVTDLAHEMDIKVVSEGVENPEQLEVMTSYGVDYIQGYHFSKPLPEKEFIEFIGANK